ncbi:porin [Pseudoalteromonas sp. MMG010]|uniref:porin n=1 Tax=Pseudoalteromonas sp. MMG010 TaxID=2822685 RepID=UPI001B3A0D42|nr:porin [Pseudoalteromonas sp. MMG010]MBQ4832817.1 porin [Pseudoalteromonas sp. MMG010]
MNIKKSSVCVLFSVLPFSALADINWYGSANISVESTDEGEGSFTQIKSNLTSIGFKGSEKLSSSFTAVYKFEMQLNPTDDSKDNVTARNQYIGVKGAFGQVVIGRNDTALKQSQGKLDLFNNLTGDIKTVFDKVGENRLTDTISYSTHSYNGFKLLSTYKAKGSSEAKSGYSLALTYGDALLKDSGSYFAIAHDNAINNFDTLRVSAQTKYNAFKFGAMYQTQETILGEQKADGFLVNVAYLQGKNTFKVQYQTIDFENADKPSGISLGVDHKFNKNGSVFAYYTGLDMDTNEDESALGVGLLYKF